MGRRGWLSRWDDRNQRVVDRQNAAGRLADKRRTTFVSPSGVPVKVVAVRRGERIRPGIYLGAVGGVILLIEGIVAAVQRRRFPDVWTVAVLDGRTASETVIHLEYVATEDAAAERVAEIRELIVSGAWVLTQLD